jgi:lipopolysaccharide/colanic/teichoic acid biosynthesis glycosyltransferase
MTLLNRRRYGSRMRSIRRYQCFWRWYADPAKDQMRRLTDLVIAGVVLVVTSPLMLFVALAISREGPGSIFERQTCIGRGGRRFQMLKFRTMVPDPEHTNPVWARKTTQIGEFLRYSRIERLPQLFNVLRGEMSLVDPEGSSPSFLE